MLRIRVLGELQLEGSEGPIELGGSWRASWLLAWLALHPGSHLRSDLAPRFWPDVLDSSARASLRNGLWAIRRALGPDASALETTRERVGLASGADVWIDATAFSEHVSAGELEEALELNRGELLAGLDEEWALEPRDEHREALSELLERLAERAEERGDLAEAITLARRRAALDGLDEDAQRSLIARLARSGDRAGALSAYGRVRDRFRSELGISPAEATRELAHGIREGEPAEDSPAGSSVTRGSAEEGGGRRASASPFPLPPRLRHRARSGFVGREAELARLRDSWAQVAAGEGARLVLLSGEAGIGKSRLAREIAIEAAADGAIVLHGVADEDLLVPHQPLVMALAHLLAVASQDELDRHVTPRAADLAPVAPGLEHGDEVEAGGDGGESSRYRLFEAIASLLESLAGAAGAVLVVDDLQWADQSTVAILRHAFESHPDMRLLGVATQRTSDAPSGDAAAEAVQRLVRSDFVERIGLPGLSDSDVGLLAEGIGGHGLPRDLVSGIREQTGGNPFFVQEIVSEMREAGEQRVVALERVAVPERVRDVIDLRLARLDPDCVRLLTVASVIGTEFALAPLERISDLEGDDLTAALDRAAAADVILEDEDHEGEIFSFSHALLRRTLLERVTKAHQRRIHARVADALEETDGEAALLEIAHHLCEARPVSDRERALDYAVRAAERATSDLAYAEAVDLFTRARSLLPEGDERRRTLALKRAVAYQALFHISMDAPPGG